MAHVGASVVHSGKTLVGANVGVDVSKAVVGDSVSHVPHNWRQIPEIVTLLQLALVKVAHVGGSGEHGSGVGADVGTRVGEGVGLRVGALVGGAVKVHVPHSIRQMEATVGSVLRVRNTVM